MSKKAGIIVAIVLLLIAFVGVLSMRMRRSQMMMGMGGSSSNVELTAVSPDGTVIPLPAEVEAVTGKLPTGTAAQQVDDVIVVLSLNPYPGTMRQPTLFSVKLMDANGQPIDDASITLDLTMPAMNMPQNQPELAFLSTGQYEGQGQFTMRGWWRIEVIIARDGQTRSAFFDLGL